MEKKFKTIARRLTTKMLICILCLMLALSYAVFKATEKATLDYYSELCHTQMLVTYEYTRRVISDVYVAVTNNVYYLEQALDKPDNHKETMARIVQSGTRVRSCGVSFIKDYYYPMKGHRFCPYAWRNVAKPDMIWKEDMGDADLDYLNDDWFQEVIETDSALWSDPFYDSYDAKTALAAYMVPVHDPEGRPIAVLGADISLNWLTDKLNEAENTTSKSSLVLMDLLGQKSTSYIINHDGTYITHPSVGHILKENFFSQVKTCDGNEAEELIANIRDGKMSENKNHQKFLVNDEECYVYYIPVKYTKWVIVTVVPCKAFYHICYVNCGLILLLLLLPIILVTIVAYYLIKNGMEPLKQLTKSADDIANGNFATPMPNLSHNDEICQLRDSMERMQYMLSNYVDDIKRDTPNKQP